MWGKWRLVAYSVFAAITVFALGLSAMSAEKILTDILTHGERPIHLDLLAPFRHAVSPLQFIIPLALLIWHWNDYGNVDAKTPFTFLLLLVFIVAAFFAFVGWWIESDELAIILSAQVAVADVLVIFALICAWFWMLNLCLRATRILRERETA